jgi:hypothetical protein
MSFRRSRVNVKPNVQATRPVGSIARSQDTIVDSIPTQSQEEQSTQEIEVAVASPIIKGRKRRTRFYFHIQSKSSYENK